MAGNSIEVIYTVPTICGPVSDFKELTLSSNATFLGWLGFGMGILVPVLFVIGWTYAAPWVVRRFGWS